MLENRMVIDSEWDEIEYGVKREPLHKRQSRAFEEEEMEDDYGIEKYHRGFAEKH